MNQTIRTFVAKIPLAKPLWRITKQWRNILKNVPVRKHLTVLERVSTFFRLNKEHPKIIVSFTSIPTRMDTITLVIDSINNQSMKPDKILLWLAKEQFPNQYADLPAKLIDYAEKGKVELRWCDNLGSHKKYYYAMQEFPDDIIIIIDDDTEYHPDTIKTLYKLHRSFPNTVSCLNAKLIVFDDKGIALAYKYWIFDIHLPVPSMQVIPMGGGGVLYPPHVLDNKVFDKDDIILYGSYKDIIRGDDIWLKIHSILAGTPAVVQPDRSIGHRTIKTTQQFSIGNYYKPQSGNYIDIFSSRKSSDSNKTIITLFKEAKNKGDYYDVNSQVVKERTYKYCLENLNKRIVATKSKASSVIGVDFCNDVLLWFNRAMTHGDEELSANYLKELKEMFLSIPNVKSLSEESIFVRALIENDAILLEKGTRFCGTYPCYMQLLKNWNRFLENNPDCDIAYKKAYKNFLGNMLSFSNNMTSFGYLQNEILECKKAVSVALREVNGI